MPEIPDWVTETPEPQPTYVLMVMEGARCVQEIEVLRKEFIALKTILRCCAGTKPMPQQKAEPRLKMLGALKRRRALCKVRAIKGEYVPEVVTQAALDRALGAQQAAWLAIASAAREYSVIETAISRGASVEPGPCEFNPELRAIVYDASKAI